MLIATAVTFVPVAATVVILIVAQLIADHLGHVALPRAEVALVIAVEALALTTLGVVIIFATAITSIPITERVVIAVVTNLVALVHLHQATAGDRGYTVVDEDERAVEARTVVAKSIIIFGSAAVTSVPLASGVVVAVVTLTIPSLL